MGAKNIPSQYKLDKVRKEILKKVGDPTRQVVAASGNVFHLNDVGAAIAKVSFPSVISPLVF